MLNAARAGNVVIANAVGNGVGDDKLVYTYVPEMIEYYLGEKPLLPNVDTFRCWLADEQTHVLDQLDELVLKPVEGSGGYGIVFGPNAARRQLQLGAQADPGRPARLDRAAGGAAVHRADQGRRAAACPGTWTCGRSRSTTARTCSCCPAGSPGWRCPRAAWW